MQAQEPPLGFKDTKILLLPPPPPPNATNDALQMPSVATGEDTRKQEKSIGTPPTSVLDKRKQVEEKEETRDEEKTAIQTLVELQKIGTPT